MLRVGVNCAPKTQICISPPIFGSGTGFYPTLYLINPEIVPMESRAQAQAINPNTGLFPFSLALFRCVLGYGFSQALIIYAPTIPPSISAGISSFDPFPAILCPKLFHWRLSGRRKHSFISFHFFPLDFDLVLLLNQVTNRNAVLIFFLSYFSGIAD